MNPLLAVCLALLGWSEHTVDGSTVWLHVSGFVVYHQGMN